MWTFFNLASNTVTCHEKLLDSIEGIECLLYQSFFLLNSGNLRRALISFRRASTLAQFMGLHHTAPSEFKAYDSASNPSGTVMWARIAHMERYLSLLLGMPSAIPRRAVSATPGGSLADHFERKQTAILMVERAHEKLTTT